MAFKKYVAPTAETVLPEDPEALRELLEAADPARRVQAVNALARLEGTAPILVAHLARESQPNVRESLLLQLSRQLEPAVVTALLALLRSEDVALRSEVCATLQQMDARIAPAVRPLLQDEDHDVRQFAVEILAVLDHPEVPDWMLEVLHHEPEANVVAAAANCLRGSRLPEARAALDEVTARFPEDDYLLFVVASVRADLED